MIAHIGTALRRSARIAIERPRATLWTLAAVTCALFAVGLAAIAADNVERWANDARGSSASMVVYLGEGLDDAGARRLAGELGRVPGVERVELVPAAETAKRLEQSLGSDAALLDGVDVASMPPSLEVRLAPGMRDVLEMSPTMRSLRAAPGVADIAIEEGAKDATGALSIARAVAWIGAALFGALALVVVLAAVRLRLERSRQERATLELLGAAPSFTFVPTALAGALHGIVAALAAAAALWIVLASYGDAIASSLQGALGSIELASPALPELALFCAIGAGLGMLGGGLAGASRATR